MPWSRQGGVVLGADPGAHPFGGGGEFVQCGQHGLVVSPGPAEDIGIGGRQASLRRLQVTEQGGERTLFRTAQIAHTPKITGQQKFV